MSSVASFVLLLLTSLIWSAFFIFAFIIFANFAAIIIPDTMRPPYSHPSASHLHQKLEP